MGRRRSIKIVQNLQKEGGFYEVQMTSATVLFIVTQTKEVYGNKFK